MLTKKLAVVAAILMLFALSSCGDDEPKNDETSGSEPTTSAPTAVDCDYTEDGSPPAREVTTPPATPEVSGTVHVVIKTSVGDIPIDLDADKAPCTVGSFVSLAEQDYYDDTQCHRLAATTGFQFLQCGDPTASGTGGPGYTIPDELSGDETYDKGVIAMANTGAPHTGGGQFFLVFGDTQLNGPLYTIFGTINPAGLEVLKKVGQAGTDDSEGPGVGRPRQKVVFKDVVVG